MTTAAPFGLNSGLGPFWDRARHDVERNLVDMDGQRYFAAGSVFGHTVYTRDISYAGVLALNRLYPNEMWSSLRVTREVRSRLAFRVSRGYAVPEIPAPWQEEDCTEPEFRARYRTNSYTRRTDDVVWLWCAGDLLETNLSDDPSWRWVYETGERFFRDFYDPFHDASDGLYWGQASFVDVHFVEHKTTGYPQHWTVGDCVLTKSLSTNALYVLGLDTMARCARKLGYSAAAQAWGLRRDLLAQAIRRHLSFPDGTFSYLKDRWGQLQPRRDALGSSLAVLAEVVRGPEARQALDGYPVSEWGVPLFLPFFDEDTWYHNHSAWPFVDTFFLMARERAYGLSEVARNAELLMRTCVGDGSFHEVVDFRSGEVKGSGNQLWSAAAFLGTSLRAGWPIPRTAPNPCHPQP